MSFVNNMLNYFKIFYLCFDCRLKITTDYCKMYIMPELYSNNIPVSAAELVAIGFQVDA